MVNGIIVLNRPSESQVPLHLLMHRKVQRDREHSMGSQGVHTVFNGSQD